MFNIEIIYALPTEQIILTLKVEPGTTIEQAIQQSDVLKMYPEIDLTVNQIGVYSQRKPLNYELLDKDRIEIYRALIADPKQVRRNRAEIQRKDGILK